MDPKGCQDTPIFDSAKQDVWISDPSHALFGCKVKLFETSSPRGKNQIVVVLADGQHRSVPISSVSSEDPFKTYTQSAQEEPSLISVRSLLPLATLVAVKLEASREVRRGHEAQQGHQANKQPLPTTRFSTPGTTGSVPSQTAAAQKDKPGTDNSSS